RRPRGHLRGISLRPAFEGRRISSLAAKLLPPPFGRGVSTEPAEDFVGLAQRSAARASLPGRRSASLGPSSSPPATNLSGHQSPERAACVPGKKAQEQAKKKDARRASALRKCSSETPVTWRAAGWCQCPCCRCPSRRTPCPCHCPSSHRYPCRSW